MYTHTPRQRARILRPDEVIRIFKETHIPTVEEVVERVGRRYRKLRPRKPGKKGIIEFELQRVQLVYNILKSVFDKLASLPPTEAMNDFHKTLIRELIGEKYDEAIKRARFIRKMLEKLWDDYRLLIVTSESPRETARLRREAVGRLISLLRRYRKHLDTLLRVKEEILKTHVISEQLPVVVIAGIPSAGKSTLISILSTAKPEVAPYPFTTKNIIVGKTRCGGLDVYLVDTPGLLDRPYEELNEIEKKAYIALKTLPHLLIYMFDVSPERVVDIDGQLHLLDQIIRDIVETRGIEILPVINKIDIADPEAVKRVKESIKNRRLEFIEISAQKMINIDKLLKALCEKAVERYLTSLDQRPSL